MTMITPSYLGETIEYSSLHACRSTLEDPTHQGHQALRQGQQRRVEGSGWADGDPARSHSAHARGVERSDSRTERRQIAGGVGVTFIAACGLARETVAAANVIIKGVGWAVPRTATHLAGILRGGGYDPDTNTLYLGGGIGHPRGVVAAGGDPSKATVAGITVFERADGNVYWSNDSISLRGRLTPQEVQMVQHGLEQAYPGKQVQQLASISHVPLA